MSTATAPRLVKSVKTDEAGNPLRHPDNSGAQWLHYAPHPDDCKKDEQGNLVLDENRKPMFAEDGWTLLNCPGIEGLITLDDGSIYDVTEHWVVVRDEDLTELHHKILDEFHARGKHLGVSHETMMSELGQ